MNKIYDCVVVGGGQAGLAAGYYLQKANQEFLILEASDQPAGSWPFYYESLTLFSPAHYSSLPAFPFPGHPDRYPTRDEVIQYLTDYATRFRLPIRTNIKVIDIQKEQNLFIISTLSGETFQAKSVISATGGFSKPYMPVIPGDSEFQGTILHSKDYINTAAYQNQRVIIVGAGNSAVQIGVELAEVAQVTLATKEPIKFVPQTIWGKDLHFWITILGLDNSRRYGKRILNFKSTGVLDTGIYQKAIANQKPNRKQMFTRFVKDGIVWSDGTSEKVDTVIFATGFRPNSDYLSSLNALDTTGSPLHQMGISSTVDGLYYIGIPWQQSHASATIRGVGQDADYVVNHLTQRSRPFSDSKASCC